MARHTIPTARRDLSATTCQTGRDTEARRRDQKTRRTCVVDRLIQQALLQVLEKRWDPTFSEHSYGFRPGRSAHQAVTQAQRYVAEGYGVVVDLDLERFFGASGQA